MCTFPPQVSGNVIHALINYLTDLHRFREFVLGDFNLCDVDWSSLSGTSTSSSIFTEFVFNTNLYQHIDSPTHKGGNILDLIFSQSPTLVHNVTVRDSQPLLGVTSDHFLISFLISHSVSKSNSKIYPPFYFDFARCDFSEMVDYLLDTDFSHYYSSTDIEYLWSTLKGIIDISVELYVPKVWCTSQKYPKWFNGEIRHHLHQLHSLRRKLCKSNNCSLYLSKVGILEDTLQGEIATARSNYEAALVDEFAFSNDNAIYKHICGLLNSNSLPNIVTFEGKSESTDKGRAHLFNSFFHSVFSPIRAFTLLFFTYPTCSVSGGLLHHYS